LGTFAHNLLADEDPQARVKLRNWTGPIRRVIILDIKKNPQKPPTFLYFGEPKDVSQFYPLAWKWSDGSPFLNYMAKRERELLHNRQVLKKSQHKWQQEYLINFQLDWKDPWLKDRGKKEGGFLWSIWHRAVATNTWRAVISEVVLDCPSCDLRLEENFLHRFYFCPQVKIAWAFAFTIIYRLERNGTGPARSFSFEQCTFGKEARF
jgi:hypothetical protein